MANLELKDMPDELLSRLQEAAAVSHRDVIHEVIERLDRSFNTLNQSRLTKDQRDKLLKRIRVGGPNDWLTPEFIRAAREEGRD